MGKTSVSLPGAKFRDVFDIETKELMSSSPGMEEYIEATSFLYYLETGELIPLATVQANLSDPETNEPVGHPLVCKRRLRESLKADEAVCDRHTGRLHLGHVGPHWRADALCYEWWVWNRMFETAKSELTV